MSMTLSGTTMEALTRLLTVLRRFKRLRGLLSVFSSLSRPFSRRNAGNRPDSDNEAPRPCATSLPHSVTNTADIVCNASGISPYVPLSPYRASAEIASHRFEDLPPTIIIEQPLHTSSPLDHTAYPSSPAPSPSPSSVSTVYSRPSHATSHSSVDVPRDTMQRSCEMKRLSCPQIPSNQAPFLYLDATGGFPCSTNGSATDVDDHLHATQSDDRSEIDEPDPLDLFQHRIVPMTPESVKRYERGLKIPRTESQFIIPPLTMSPPVDALPEGWTRYVHPEGAQYFHHAEKRVYTDLNVFEQSKLEDIQRYLDTIVDAMRILDVELIDGMDLVLDDYVFKGDSEGCQYYVVNHEERSVFWLEEVDSTEIFDIGAKVDGMSSSSILRLELEAQYWRHCELYPHAMKTTTEIVDELRDTLVYSRGDLLTSSNSTVSWSIDEISHFQSMVDSMTQNIRPGTTAITQTSGINATIARLMHMSVRHRVFNFHGEPAARLCSDQAVYDQQRKRSWFISIFSPLLFFAPHFHLDGLEVLYTDGVIREHGWTQFISRLLKDWQDFTLNATVILNANVAFLAIQSVDNGGSAVSSRTPTQLASYCSIFTSVGAIIFGLLLVKQNRNRSGVGSIKSESFFFKYNRRRLGMETLAVVYSLPYALLIWSMLAFLAAFLSMCFRNTNSLTRAFVAAFALLVVSFGILHLADSRRGSILTLSIPKISIPTIIWPSWSQADEESAVELGSLPPSTVVLAESPPSIQSHTVELEAPNKRRRPWLSLLVRKDSVEPERSDV
ncbi:unnamed protein product [Mycena citricolor]|uniref:WW domain-containing protein n=1 Tax=Mycena citricolor TaxID=2018698 RepID=A0AAD2K4B3_9AGAR|nr:unnamed protein product [Mycena citricolor]